MILATYEHFLNVNEKTGLEYITCNPIKQVASTQKARLNFLINIQLFIMGKQETWSALACLGTQTSFLINNIIIIFVSIFCISMWALGHIYVPRYPQRSEDGIRFLESKTKCGWEKSDIITGTPTLVLIIMLKALLTTEPSLGPKNTLSNFLDSVCYI